MQSTQQFSGHADSLAACKLHNRGLIRATGSETSDFLQGLITNDIQRINMRSGVPSLYSLFLNTKGRIMNDLLVYRPQAEPDTYFIECDRELEDQFVRDISRYKIRKKVVLSVVSDQYDVWAVFPSELEERDKSIEMQYVSEKRSQIVASTHDPRLKAFGRRLILPNQISGLLLFRI